MTKYWENFFKEINESKRDFRAKREKYKHKEIYKYCDWCGEDFPPCNDMEYWCSEECRKNFEEEGISYY